MQIKKYVTNLLKRENNLSIVNATANIKVKNKVKSTIITFAMQNTNKKVNSVAIISLRKLSHTIMFTHPLI